MIAGRIAAAASLQVLDLGCGAGRCGSFLRPYAARLVGIDLSAGLLGQAAARGLYDHLEAGDPLTRLARGRGDWDLLVAAGSQPAKADLAALFDGAAASLRDGGLLALSVPGVDGAEALARGRFEIIDRA